MPAVQLPLGIRLDDSATFGNFYPGENTTLLSMLRENHEPFIYFWGVAGSGKSHLLQASCHASARAGEPVIYLPLAGDEPLTPEIFEGIEAAAVICIDDVQAIAGQRHWEEAMFHLYNRIRDNSARLRVSAGASPAAAGMTLPDLASRLAWGMTFQLHALNDTQKIAALQLRARSRGIELPDEVAQYLIKQVPRDMHSLFAVLERLDEVSLQQQRRLTIPFVKEWLA